MKIMRNINMTFFAKRSEAGVAAALAIACVAPGSVWAGPEDAVNFVAGTSATYDNNLFRLSSGAAVPLPARTRVPTSSTRPSPG